MKSEVLYVCGDTSQMGGIEKYNRDFIRAILELGYFCDVIQRKPGGFLEKILFGLAIARYVIHRIPKHVICGHLHFAPLINGLSRVRHFDFSVNIYGIEAIEITCRRQIAALKAANRIIVISAYTKGLLLNQFPELSEKIFMLKSSVDENQFWPIANKEQIKEKYDLKDAKVILSVARLSSGEEKGQDRVLQAFRKILKKIPEVVYVIAGPGSDWRIDELLEDPALAERVRKLGPISEKDKNELYNLCDVFVLPSKNEGFGIVFIEALATGTRVIASDGFGCREGLLDGKLGRLVDPDDSESIAEAILDILMLSSKDEWSIRSDLRDESLKIYGYEAWKRCVNEFANEAF